MEEHDTAADLADEIRRLIETLQVTDIPPAELDELVVRIRDANESLRAFPRRTSWYAPGGPDAEGVFEVSQWSDLPISHIHRSPITGRLNAAAPPLDIRLVNDDDHPRATGSVTFTATHEGAPGIVHGGWIAAVMDEILGFAQPLSGSAGFTGTITVRYRSPAPTYTRLSLIGSVDRVEGRKIFVSGTCETETALVAEAEAVCIVPTRS